MFEFYKKSLEILKSSHYITIATVSKHGIPWNTPVSAAFDKNLNFYWGSSPNSIHSENIKNNQNVFVVIFDSHQEEGTGVGLYMLGTAKENGTESDHVTKYIFVPEKIWINDEEKDDSGKYMYDIRIELNKDNLINSL